MKLSTSLAGTLFALGGLASKKCSIPDQIESSIKTEQYVVPTLRVLLV